VYNILTKQEVRIASKVGHVTLATPPLGSFTDPYVVVAMAYPTKKNEAAIASSVLTLWRAGSHNLKSRSHDSGHAHLGDIHHHSSFIVRCVVLDRHGRVGHGSLF